MEPKRSHRSFAAAAPILRIPRAKITLSRGAFFDSSMAAMRFFADFSPMRSRAEMSSALREYMSAAVSISFFSRRADITAGPIPSMFIAPFEQKWSMFLYCCAGHSVLGHLSAASSSYLTAFAPHTGHSSGRVYGTEFSA